MFGNDGNGIVIKRLNSDEESSGDSDSESVASSSGRSNVDAPPIAKVPRTSDGQKPTDLLTDVCWQISSYAEMIVTSVWQLYTVFQKRSHQTFGNNFFKSWAILKILSLTDSAGSLL